ncbi:hypothetical protein D8S78_05525 [Natrialba swarupiae]|nr:hypothetical protein [Natrialba swarupiae]
MTIGFVHHDSRYPTTRVCVPNRSSSDGRRLSCASDTDEPGKAFEAARTERLIRVSNSQETALVLAADPDGVPSEREEAILRRPRSSTFRS